MVHSEAIFFCISFTIEGIIIKVLGEQILEKS